MSPDDDFRRVLEALGAGHLGEARDRIEQLRRTIPPDAPIAVRAVAARAEATACRLDGDLATARVCVEEAIDLAADPRNDDPLVAVDAELERAEILRAGGDADAASRAFERARRLVVRASVPELVRWRVEMRTAVHELETRPEAGIERLERLAAEIPDVPAAVLDAVPSGQRLLLLALERLASGESDDALLGDLGRAADAARADEDLAAYTGARLATAQVLESRGDRVGAYRSLAVGWATVRAAFGADEARRTFTPSMVECRERWGAEDFARVKAIVDADVHR